MKRDEDFHGRGHGHDGKDSQQAEEGGDRADPSSDWARFGGEFSLLTPPLAW